MTSYEKENYKTYNDNVAKDSNILELDLEIFNKENIKVPLILHGINLVEQDKTRLKSQIQEIINTEIDTYLEQIQIKESTPNQPDKIVLSLQSLNLPYEIQNKIETEVKKMVKKEFIKDNVDETEGGCIFTPVDPPGQRRGAPHLQQVGEVIDWNPSSGDSFRVELAYSNHQPNEMWIGLQTGENNPWAKEIQSFNIRPYLQRGNAVRVERPHQEVNWLYLKRATCYEGADTIIFRKPEFLGVWVDKWYFSNFWETYGGKSVIFRWIRG